MNSPDSFAEIDLVAYHLHELPPQQELAIRNALQLNPALAADSKAIAATLRIFERQEYPTMIDTQVLDNHWQRLRPSLKPHRARSPFAAWMLPLTLAAAVTLLLVVAFWLFSASSPSSSLQQAATPQSPSPSPGGPSSPWPIPPAAHAAPTHAPAPDQREAELTPTPFPRISIPSIEPPFESPSLDTNLAFANIPPSLTGTVPAPPPNPAPSSTPPPAKRPRKQTDFSIGVLGNFMATRSRNEALPGSTTYFNSESASPSLGVIAAFHQQFRPWLGYRIASSYTRATFSYANVNVNPIGGFVGGANINAGMHELTAAYTAQGPSNKRVSTDAEAGAGVLVFVPSPASQVSYNYRRAAVGGVGLNFHITPRLDLRTEYRALVYQVPSFRIGLEGRYTVSSEPTVSLTYHFGSATTK